VDAKYARAPPRAERQLGTRANASARIEQATQGAGIMIVEIADELDARLIVCGRRGRGAVTSALLGSVSHAVLAHAGRPVLIAPER
jgi:nucleotide-binding universal stress UspA family protein